jgi:hypothetical protein
MPRNHLPTYAIVELLIRLSIFNPAVGDYKNHNIYAHGVVVKTTAGSITLPLELIIQQFEEPHTITDQELKKVASAFTHAN